MKFSCPKCDQHLQCDERMGGRQITCPACHHLINVPAGPNQSIQSGRTWDTFVVPKLPPEKPGKPNPEI